MATDEGDCCLLALRCSFINRALKAERRKGSGGGEGVMVGRLERAFSRSPGIIFSPSRMETLDQGAAKEIHGQASVSPWNHRSLL